MFAQPFSRDQEADIAFHSSVLLSTVFLAHHLTCKRKRGERQERREGRGRERVKTGVGRREVRKERKANNVRA
jgi:hypothetical protein